jgi:predicted RNase H-like HicB family nuclease
MRAVVLLRWWYNNDMANAKLNQLAVELIADPTEGGFTVRVPDIPAYGEGETEDAAIADLKEALRGYIATFGMDDKLQRLNSPIKVRFVEMDLAELGRA